jgi:hypothetical protein
MATVNYTSLLGLALPTQGDLSGQWGNEVNNYITSYLDSSIAGQLVIALTGNLTLTKSTGTSLGSTSSQYAILNVTPNTSTWTITAPALSKIYVINNLSGTYTFDFKASGGSAITIGASEKCVVAYNGTDFLKVGASLASPYTANGILYANSTTSLTTGTELSWSGTALNARGASASTITTGTTANRSAAQNVGLLTFAAPNASGTATTWGGIRSFTGSATAGSESSSLYFSNMISGVSTDSMVLNASGNLGIGTTAPISKLTVLGAATINAPETSTTGGSIQTASYGITTRTGNLDLGATDALAADIGGSLTFSARYLTGSNVAWVTGKIAGYREVPTSTNASSYLAFATSNTAGDLAERMRLNSSGNLGLGVTPSAWGSGKKSLQIGTDLALFYNAANDSAMTVNAYDNGTNNIYLTSNYATKYTQNVGQHIWYNAPSGTAGNPITFTQAMTLNSSGNLLVGTTSNGSFNGRICASKNLGKISIGSAAIDASTAVVDTGISINQLEQGGCLLLLASRNTTTGTFTDAAVYIIRFYYDGNNPPTTTYVGGSANFVVFGVSGSNTLTVQNPDGGNATYSWFGNK